jgi:hypothetical protein
MNTIWKLEEAKKSFDSIIEEALAHHAQIIELKNQQQVVIISLEDYKQNLKPKNTLVDFFKESPLYDLPLDLERDKDTGRTIEL